MKDLRFLQQYQWRYFWHVTPCWL